MKQAQDDEVLKLHGGKERGVLSIAPRFAVTNREELAEAYTPGVAEISKLIEHDPAAKAKYTMSGKLVAMVTDGSAVLGLGNIGPAGGLPIIEGKALLYKDLAAVDAIPLTLDQVPVDEFVQTLKTISKSFAGFHLEDIGAPRCFEIEEKLAQAVDIPVYHDDQEGTAIVVLAALINAAKVVNKPLSSLQILINGVGASGVATARLLLAAGITNLTLVDIHGPVRADDDRYNPYQRAIARQSKVQDHFASLDEAIVDQDVFIGLSDAKVLNASQVQAMAPQPIIFALANPIPEIDPGVAQQAGAAVVATGSSQYPNQVNNILAFPGLFKGLLATGLKKVTPQLELAIAQAIAGLVDQPTANQIVPGVFEPGVVKTVTTAVTTYADQVNPAHES